MWVDNNDVNYLDSFCVEHITKEIKAFIDRSLSITTNIFSIKSIKMKSYGLKSRKDTENINPRVSKTSNGRTMVLSKNEICGSKKSRFIKNQEAKGQFRS